MKKYRIIVEGSNCLLSLEGKGQAEKYGFFTTRFIESVNQKEAIKLAFKLIEEEFKSVLLNKRTNKPILVVDEIIEVENFGDNLVPGGGATWYKEV